MRKVLPSLKSMLERVISIDGKTYTMLYRSGKGPDNFNYSISLFFDHEKHQFVNGSYKKVQVKNGCRSTWRQDLMQSQGYGNYTYRGQRISADEAKQHIVTPDITPAYFKDPVYDGAVERLFDADKTNFATMHGTVNIGKIAKCHLQNNPLYNKDLDKAIRKIEEDYRRNRDMYDPWR